MRFTKIKNGKDGVELSWVEKKEGGAEIACLFDGPEKPLPAFVASLAAFRPFVVSLIGAPKPWLELITVSSLTIEDTKDGRRSLIVSATKTLPDSNRPFVINTPLMSQRGENTSDDASGIFDDEILELIIAAEAAAEDYFRGAREQLDAFIENGKKPDTENSKAFSERAAAAETASTRKPRPKKGAAKFVPEVGAPSNPDGIPVDDSVMRSLLLTAGRDVPVDAINRWSSSEREAARGWAEAMLHPSPFGTGGIVEPDVLKKDATPALLDDHIAAKEEAKSEEGWSDGPPPKVDDAGVEAVRSSLPA